jgi:hypothetical protein
MYTLLTWVSVQLDFAPMDRQSMETDVDCQTGGSEMSSASQNPESDDEDHKGAIYAAHVIDAIHLYLCILCHFSMAHPRLNEVCPSCSIKVNKDPPLRFLHDMTLHIFRSFIPLLWNSLSARPISTLHV